MIDIEEEQRKDANLRHQIKRVNTILVGVILALIVGPITLALWVEYRYPRVSSLRIENVEIIGATELCPGDMLLVAYTFNAEGAGVLIKDATTWRITPPETVIYSDWSRFVLTEAAAQRELEVWPVPTTMFNVETGEKHSLQPGAYERRIAISSPTNSQAVAIESVAFSIKEDCP
jgi:hypothetical protein